MAARKEREEETKKKRVQKGKELLTNLTTKDEVRWMSRITQLGP